MSDILGSYPKVISRNPRNVNSDQFISEYLKNEQKRNEQVRSQVRIRNPFYAGSVFYLQDSNNEQPKRKSMNSLSLNQNKSELVFSKKVKEPDEKQIQQIETSRQIGDDAKTIKTLKSKSTINRKQKKKVSEAIQTSEQIPLETQKIPILQSSKLNAAGRPTKKQAFSILPLNSDEKLQQFDKLPLIQPHKEIQKKTFDQNLENFYNVSHVQQDANKEYALYNPIAHQKLDYKPNRNITASWGQNKYNRPQFRDFIASQVSPTQMVAIKNRIDCAVGFQTSSQAYGFGLQK